MSKTATGSSVAPPTVAEMPDASPATPGSNKTSPVHFAKKSAVPPSSLAKSGSSSSRPDAESSQSLTGLEADEEIGASSEDGYSKHEDEDEEDEEDLDDLPQEDVNAMLSNLVPSQQPTTPSATTPSLAPQFPTTPTPGNGFPPSSPMCPSAASTSAPGTSSNTNNDALSPGSASASAMPSPAMTMPLGAKADIRTLIMAAIGVMKNRKARPDSKRISNWIHRRHGHPYLAVTEELDRLVQVGELAKVDYKGSSSYRIVGGKTTKRRRRSNKPLGRNPNIKTATRNELATSSSPSSLQQHPHQLPAGILPTPPPAGAPHIRPTGPASFPVMPISSPSNDRSSSPVSLRSLVNDLMAGDMLTANGQGMTVTYQLISKAVETSQRGISRSAVLGNLDLILEKEVKAGHFIRIGKDEYKLPYLPNGPIVGGVALPTGPSPSSLNDLSMLQTPVPKEALIHGAPPQPYPLPPPSPQKQQPPMAHYPHPGMQPPPPHLAPPPQPMPPQFRHPAVSSAPAQQQQQLQQAQQQQLHALQQQHQQQQHQLHHQQQMQQLHQQKQHMMLPQHAPPLPHLHHPPPYLQQPPPPQPPILEIHKSEEERKNDLIQEKLSKLSSSSKDPLRSKSPGKRLSLTTSSTTITPITPTTVVAPSFPCGQGEFNNSYSPAVSIAEKEPKYLALRRERMARAAASAVQKKAENETKGTASEGDESSSSTGTGTNEKSSNGRRSSMKKRRSKEAASRQKQDSPKNGLSRKKKREAWSLTSSGTGRQRSHLQEHNSDSNSSFGALDSPNTGGAGRPGSMRKKKSRKIFDPADHDQPARKRKVSSSPPPPGSENADIKPNLSSLSGTEASPSVKIPLNGSSEKSSLPGETADVKREPDTCIYCGQGDQKKGKTVEKLLYCKDCDTVVHPSCMDYTPELVRKIAGTQWQCISCKTCSVCQEGHDDPMIFCDTCDLGYHMNCHTPEITTERPASEKWECHKCNPKPRVNTRAKRSLSSQEPTNETSSPIIATSGVLSRRSSNNNTLATFMTNGNGAAAPPPPTTNNNSSSKPDENHKFMSVIPEHLHPATGLLPPNWEDYPVDPSIPNVEEWNPSKVTTYFLQQGFRPDVAGIFMNEDIDGRALLLLHRQDVLSSLGLKIGPALKIFSHIKRLQTRRNFPH